MKASEAGEDARGRDWILVDKESGMIMRGLTREAVAWMVDAPIEKILAALQASIVFESGGKLVVGEWRRR